MHEIRTKRRDDKRKIERKIKVRERQGKTDIE